MPRVSAEARAASSWRNGGIAIDPPKRLSAEAKALWREIVEDRPSDFFRPGAHELLAQFCEVSVAQRAALAELALLNQASGDESEMVDRALAMPAVVKRVRELGAVVLSTAAALRLSVQAEVDRKSGKLTETAPKSKGRRALGPLVPNVPLN